MNCSPKLPTTKHEGVREPLVGSGMPQIVQAGKGNLSDWMELMEAVEALCPVWPVRGRSMAKQSEFRL
ncbi:MAG: hypothetical protein EPN49_16120 [Rhodanobacter sp.]|nr:MAG: hypothetical protein EPN49_16120 [Rhodanobacter sp.]